ncbi:DUF2283 domain-containing protein [Rubrobacter calidifluminis]|uniref:DUF2283 domain-containing protein n=1 Tax=Rubrobacter calidifluminis TaxID=1392640 RepID=UPI0023612999|nr:DUF2283 domain-containing protein [Rubrobacter calidifluminis]
MRLRYYPETDSLYVDLRPREEQSYRQGEHGSQVVVSDEMVVDLDADGKPVGIDIHSFASRIVDLSRLELDGVSLGRFTAGLAKAGA